MKILWIHGRTIEGHEPRVVVADLGSLRSVQVLALEDNPQLQGLALPSLQKADGLLVRDNGSLENLALPVLTSLDRGIVPTRWESGNDEDAVCGQFCRCFGLRAPHGGRRRPAHGL